MIRFVKQWSGSYGIFEAGRIVGLPPVMLAAAPKDSYEEVEAEDVKGTESNGKNKTKPKGKAEPKSKADTGHSAVGDSR